MPSAVTYRELIDDVFRVWRELRVRIRTILRQVEATDFDAEQALLLVRLPERGARYTDLVPLGCYAAHSPSHALDKLQRLGYLARSSDPGDGRAVLLTLTDKGREMRDRLAAALEQLDAHLDAGQIAGLRRLHNALRASV